MKPVVEQKSAHLSEEPFDIKDSKIVALKHKQLSSHGYVVIRDRSGDEAFAKRFPWSDLARNNSWKRETRVDDRNMCSYYSPIETEALAKEFLPVAESLVGERLLITYSLIWIYRTGAYLEPHRDRLACEVTVSTTLATGSKQTIWPLFVDDLQGNRVRIPAMMGEIVLFEGQKVQHWREPFDGDYQIQGLFHYVRKTGPHAEQAITHLDGFNFTD